MLDFLFFVKTLAVTIFIVVLLQNKVGGVTLEDHTKKFIDTSAIVQPLHAVAKSGVVVVRSGISWVAAQVNGHFWKSKKTNEAGLGFSRSDAYQKSQEAKEAKKEDAKSPLAEDNE